MSRPGFYFISPFFCCRDLFFFWPHSHPVGVASQTLCRRVSYGELGPDEVSAIDMPASSRFVCPCISMFWIYSSLQMFLFPVLSMSCTLIQLTTSSMPPAITLMLAMTCHPSK